LECGGSTPLSFFFWSAAARRRFLSFGFGQGKKKESGVEPPHSKRPASAPRVLQCFFFWVFVRIRG